MVQRSRGAGGVVALLGLVGCSTPVVREPRLEGPRAVPGVGATAVAPSANPGSPAPVVAVTGEQMIEISSLPTGARILVNNQPMGRAPLRLALKVKPQGFCADYISVKARFLAEDADHVSQTVEVQLTPLEKAPATLVFTPEGARRQMPD